MELFVESLLVKTMEITNARQARTLSPSHMRQSIMSESRFDFLRELVKDVPNISWTDEYPPLEPEPSAATNGSALLRSVSVAERPKRNYRRPASFDEAAITAAASSDLDASSSTASGILKRKLMDASRKSASVDGSAAQGPAWKVAILDAAVEESSRDAAAERLAFSLLPPSVNLSSDSIRNPIIKIDYSQPSLGAASAVPAQITPVIKVDCSKLTSNVNNNNIEPQKLALHAAALDAASLATPNLTTPTRLNNAPQFDVGGGGAAVVGLPLALPTAASTLDLDEDYDNI